MSRLTPMTVRGRTAAVVTLGLALALGARPARAIEFEPYILVDGDYQAVPRDAEGYTGLALTRARAGVVAHILPWVHVRFAGEWARRQVALIDTYISADVDPQLELTAGFARDPLFVTGRDVLEFELAVPERSMTTQALWPGRDLGVEAHWHPGPRIPVEAWLRFGNGSGSILGNDNPTPAGSARVDLAFGRAHPRAARREDFGLRIGAGVHLDVATDRPGIGAITPLGYLFYRPFTVSGLRLIAEWHALVYLGPLQLLAEGGVARESRARDTDGNPATPREELTPVVTAGVSVELSWMITGQHRQSGLWPYDPASGRGAWELAVRAERLYTGRGSVVPAPGGAAGAALALRWWATRWLALGAAVYGQWYDQAPIEEPAVTASWSALLRATLRVQ